jgi:hypothetical protein
MIIGLVMTKSRMKPIRQAALMSALSLLALASIAPGVARAQSSDSGIFGSMLKSLGIGGENNIEYRERPPLVVPPTRDLPPPQAPGTARAPNWPVDAKATGQPKGSQVRDLDRLPVPQRAPDPSVAGYGAPGSSPDTTAAIPSGQPASGGFFGKIFSSGDRQAATPVAPAPARKSLTEPPVDYESPAPSQPSGVAPPAAAAAPATPENALQTAPGQTQPGASRL